MARVQNMTWDDRNKRWRKEYKGKAYTVSCRQLNVPETKSASQTDANAWWTRKRAEIDGQLGAAQQRWSALVAQLLAKQLEITTHDAAIELYEHAIGHPDGQRMITAIADLEDKATTAIATVTKEVDREKTVGHYFERWKVNELARGKRRAKLNIRHVDKFIQYIGPSFAVCSINEKVIEEYYNYLASVQTWDNNYKAEIWKLFKRFVRTMAASDLLREPKNLNIDILKFTTEYNEPKPWQIETIRTFLAFCDDRQKLYVLLMLNCGWRASDIGDLKQCHVNWVEGTISKVRGKLQKMGVKKLQKVTWHLWPETLKLLQQFDSKQDTVLLSEDGSPLYVPEERDLVGYALNRLRKAHGIKDEICDLRATGATLLDSHAEYGRYACYYLGEKAKETPTKRYIVPSHEQFQAALTYLHGKLFS